jgi:hypothetical protein
VLELCLQVLKPARWMRLYSLVSFMFSWILWSETLYLQIADVCQQSRKVVCRKNLIWGNRQRYLHVCVAGTLLPVPCMM